MSSTPKAPGMAGNFKNMKTAKRICRGINVYFCGLVALMHLAVLCVKSDIITPEPLDITRRLISVCKKTRQPFDSAQGPATSFKRVNFSDGGMAGKRPLCIYFKFSDFRKKGLLPAIPPSEKFFIHRIDRSLSGAEGLSSFLSDTN